MITTKGLQKLAQNGDADAQFRMGCRSVFGRNRARPTDWAGAISWWEQAAKQNHARALFYLGTCCDNGLGVARNLQTAMAFYERAAQGNHETAQGHFGLRVSQRRRRACFYGNHPHLSHAGRRASLTQAAAQKHPSAKRLLRALDAE